MELVSHCVRTNSLLKLIQRLEFYRPKINWRRFLRHVNNFPIKPSSEPKTPATLTDNEYVERLTNVGVVILTSLSAAGGSVFLKILAGELYEPYGVGLIHPVILGPLAESDLLLFGIVVGSLLLGGSIGLIVHKFFGGPRWLEILTSLLLGFLTGFLWAPLTCPFILVGIVLLAFWEDNRKQK